MKALVLKHLSLVQEYIRIISEPFSKSSFFSNGPRLYFWDNFKNWVLSEIPDMIPTFQGTLSKYKLTKNMYDKEILEELGNPTPFTIGEFAGIMKDLISKQPNGKDGDLLTNGYANIFYVKLADGRVVAVNLRWHSVNREWNCSADDLDVGQWDEGYCVFSRS